MRKQYFISQFSLPIDFLVIIWPPSQGWESGNSDSFLQDIVRAVRASWGGGGVVSKTVPV